MTGKNKTTVADNGPDPIDVHVGAMMRARRHVLSISQDELAQHLGLTFQQVQKYEKGANRVSASMLFRAADKLKVPVEHFFDGLEQASEGGGEATTNHALRLIGERGGLELAQRFIAGRPAQQAAILCCARALTPHVEAA